MGAKAPDPSILQTKDPVGPHNGGDPLTDEQNRGILCVFPETAQDSRFGSELWLAMATSLLASIFCLLSDIYVQYKNSEKDQLLEGYARIRHQ